MFYILKQKKYPGYVSKHNSNREKQVILLMIPNRKTWHYLAVKTLSALLREITWKIIVIFFVWVDFFPLEQKNSQKTKPKSKKQNKLEWHKKYVKIKIFVM